MCVVAYLSVCMQVCGYNCGYTSVKFPSQSLRELELEVGKVVVWGGGFKLEDGAVGRYRTNDAFSTPLIQWLCSPVNPSHATH